MKNSILKSWSRQLTKLKLRNPDTPTVEPGRAVRAIIGLGNPGTQYLRTRHNCGFWFVDALAKRYSVEPKLNPRFNSFLVRTQIAGGPVWLIKPITYMNRSGDAFQRIAHYYKIEPENIIVVHDELDLPAGTVKLKLTGGAGGHNGLTDIINRSATRNFPRIRIGISKPVTGADTVSYVLSTPSKHDMELIENAIDDALECIPDILNGDTERVMNILHSRRTAGREDRDNSKGG